MIMMNTYYEVLFRALRLPDSLIACAVGRIRIPIAGMDSPPNWYGFPPALMPVWSDGSGPNYYGYWKHWFSDRPPSFVKMFVGSRRMVVEIARTPEQFLSYMIMAAIGIDDGVEPSVERFASDVGITNLSELDKVSLDTGDNPLGFSAISQFRRDLPLASTREIQLYNGRFPTGDFSGSLKWWHDACSFEVPREALAAWPANLARPRWLTAGPKADIFRDFLHKGDLHAAWLTLNSSGWSIPEAKDAINRLASVAHEELFTLLASAWTSVAEAGSGGY
jgi:hypothetical protein